MRYEKKIITSADAESLLGKNPKNRAINPNRVRTMANDILTGRWMLSPQPIVVDTAGNLIDGQHRLAAVVMSGTPTEFYVCVDAPPEVMRVIDHGATRQVSDVLKIEGYAYATLLAAIARKVVAHQNGSQSVIGTAKSAGASGANRTEIASKQEVLEFAKENFVELTNAGERAEMICGKSKVRLMSSSEIGFFLYVLHPKDASEEFFLKVVGGIGLAEKTPEYKLRGILENARVIKKSVITPQELTQAVFTLFANAVKKAKN